MSDLPKPQQDDRDLLAEVRRGDRCAAATMVERLTPIVSRMVFRLTGWHEDTQDLIQNVFLAVQQSADSFRGDSKLETWVTSITIHCCRQWIRGRAGVPPNVPPAVSEPVDHSFKRYQDTTEIGEEVRLALKQIHHDDRELLVLRYLEDMPLEDIAQLLGIRKNTLEVRLHRARKELCSMLTQRAN